MSEWRKITDMPDWNDRPIYQFIRLEGECRHSGERWLRIKVGTATIERDGPFGYRESDIDRLCRDGDMDRETAVVTHWMPAIFPPMRLVEVLSGR